MANHPQALKRARQAKKRGSRNRKFKTQIKSTKKNLLALIGEKNVELTKEKLKDLQGLINKVATKRIIPKKRAARLISRLTKKANSILSAAK